MAYRPKDTKERILHRLKIVDGHLSKVIEMVELDTYCIDIIHQSQAIQRALAEVDSLVLEEHLNGCVASAISEGRKKEAISEVMNVFKRKGAHI